MSRDRTRSRMFVRFFQEVMFAEVRITTTVPSCLVNQRGQPEWGDSVSPAISSSMAAVDCGSPGLLWASGLYPRGSFRCPCKKEKPDSAVVKQIVFLLDGCNRCPEERPGFGRLSMVQLLIPMFVLASQTSLSIARSVSSRGTFGFGQCD